MDDRAYSTLERALPGVRATCISDFKPKREGEDDYSALVMAFLRAIQARVDAPMGKGSGKGRVREDQGPD